MKDQFEVEIKSLLGTKERAEILKRKMFEKDPGTTLVATSRQLNHYFVGGDAKKLLENLAPIIAPEQVRALERILADGKNRSLRTRKSDERVIVVIKASIDDTTSANGIARLEFEAETPSVSLDELDTALLRSGADYQAKWSRDREEYDCAGVRVCLDRNAGYGYVAEFECLVEDAAHADAAKETLRNLMKVLDAEELAQDRLERMFAHYNEHWPEYYGTDKIFVIE